MYTLKIKWMRYEKNGELVDESTLFIPATQIHVHGVIESDNKMDAWPEGSYFDYRIGSSENTKWSARLIKVEHNDKETWYLASLAWLLGPDGRTIERLTTN